MLDGNSILAVHVLAYYLYHIYSIFEYFLREILFLLERIKKIFNKKIIDNEYIFLLPYCSTNRTEIDRLEIG